ncbi:MAG: ABC transporter permease [Actinomycetota bacterium]
MMRKIFTIALYGLKQLSRERGVIVLILGLPLIFTFLVGFLFGGGGENRIKVSFVDKDKSSYSRLLRSDIENEKALKIESSSQSKAVLAVKEGRSAAAIVIPEDFGTHLIKGERIEVRFLSTPQATTYSAAVKEILSGSLTRLSFDASTARLTTRELQTRGLLASAELSNEQSRIFEKADKAWKPRPIEVNYDILKASQVRGKQTLASGMAQGSMGFTMLFVMMALVIGARGILEERKVGTLGRLLTTPTSKLAVLSGKILQLFLQGVVQTTILILFGRFVFGVEWGNSVAGVVILMGAFILASTGLGIMFSALVRTPAQMEALGTITVISMSMLGGAWWPIEIVPRYLQIAAKLIPTGWVMDGLTNMIVRGMGVQAAILPALVLLGFALLFFAVGLAFLRL